MKARNLKHFIYFLALMALIALDQYTKHLAVINLKDQQPIKLISGVLHLQYLENDGAVFGIFGGNAVGLAVVTSIITIGLLYFYIKLPQVKRYNILRILLVLIIAGAIGNLIDRIRLNYVVDFIYFALINFPIFNVADIYVTVSTFVFLILALFYYKDEDFEFLEK
jgi:signal peptidase II